MRIDFLCVQSMIGNNYNYSEHENEIEPLDIVTCCKCIITMNTPRLNMKTNHIRTIYVFKWQKINWKITGLCHQSHTLCWRSHFVIDFIRNMKKYEMKNIITCTRGEYWFSIELKLNWRWLSLAIVVKITTGWKIFDHIISLL